MASFTLPECHFSSAVSFSMLSPPVAWHSEVTSHKAPSQDRAFQNPSSCPYLTFVNRCQLQWSSYCRDRRLCCGDSVPVKGATSKRCCGTAPYWGLCKLQGHVPIADQI